MKKLLLQICCAPCGTYISRERLKPHYDLTWYFCNPNLISQEEYDRRLEMVKLMAEKYEIPLIIEPYEHDAWNKIACARAADPERGERCRFCYRDRLAKTAQLAKEKGFDIFGTTLLVSPYKDAAAIIEIGRELEEMSEVEFLDMDFQADDGYRRSQDLAKELGLYRQKFCGCEYSLNRISLKKKDIGSAILPAAVFMAAFLFFGIGSAQAADIGSVPAFDSESSVNTESSVDAESSVDTDADGYSDVAEIKNGYSPFNPKKVKINESDMDNDGLTDDLEIKFRSDSFDPDTDADGYGDGEEVDSAYNPLSSSTVKLSRKIEINLKSQKMTYVVGGQALKEFIISGGKASMPTPTGDYEVINKSKKAWSNKYKLWMPYWLGLGRGEFGIHELPLWPNGYREGADHLGHPVSHGCIRLGIGPAQYIYERASVGTKVIIK